MNISLEKLWKALFQVHFNGPLSKLESCKCTSVSLYCRCNYWIFTRVHVHIKQQPCMTRELERVTQARTVGDKAISLGILCHVLLCFTIYKFVKSLSLCLRYWQRRLCDKYRDTAGGEASGNQEQFPLRNPHKNYLVSALIPVVTHVMLHVTSRLHTHQHHVTRNVHVWSGGTKYPEHNPSKPN